MKQQFYTCRHCGNIMAMIHDAGVPVQCCGERMHRLEPGTTEEHYIEWICLEGEHVIQYAHLKPTDKPKAKFALCEGDTVREVYAFCNQHNLWKH